MRRYRWFFKSGDDDDDFDHDSFLDPFQPSTLSHSISVARESLPLHKLHTALQHCAAQHVVEKVKNYTRCMYCIVWEGGALYVLHCIVYVLHCSGRFISMHQSELRHRICFPSSSKTIEVNLEKIHS